MRFTHLRSIAALACGGGMIALALTGCNDGDGSTASGQSGSTGPAGSAGSAGSSAPAGKPGNTSTTAAGAPGRSTGPAGTGQGDTPSCMASELRGELQLQPSSSDTNAIATLILTNRSSETCFLPAGWTPLGKGGPHDYTAIPTARVNYPGAGLNITLRPGTSAFAGTKWHSEKGCPGGATSDLGVAWHSSWIPLTYHGLDNGFTPPICDEMTVGTLQPTMNGVNFT